VSGGTGFVVGPDEGEALWWAGSLNLMKLTGRTTAGGLDVVDHRVPAGYAPPLHVHTGGGRDLLRPRRAVSVRCGDERWSPGPGSLVFLPRGVPHGFSVSDAGPGRTLIMTTPAGFAEVVSELGVPATNLVLPGPDLPAPDPERLAAVARARGTALVAD